MLRSFFFLLTLLGLFTSGVLCAYFLVVRKGILKANRLFAGLMAVFLAQIVYSFATSNYAYQYFMSWHKPLFLLKQLSFLIGPILLFYIRSYIRPKNIFQHWYYHVIPFGVAVVTISIYYSYQDNFIIWLGFLDLYSAIAILIANLVYLIRLSTLVSKSRQVFKEVFSKGSVLSRFTWIHLILSGVIIFWVLNLNCFAGLMGMNMLKWCAYTASVYALITFIAALVLLFVILLNPKVYFRKQRMISEVSNSAGKVLDHFQQQRPYLNPELNADALASQLNLSSRAISEIINTRFKCNVNSFINSYRLEESVRQLSDPDNKRTVLEILYDSGFNSKSVFYAEFKQRYGLTPQQYRSKHKKLKHPAQTSGRDPENSIRNHVSGLLAHQ